MRRLKRRKNNRVGDGVVWEEFSYLALLLGAVALQILLLGDADLQNVSAMFSLEVWLLPLSVTVGFGCRLRLAWWKIVLYAALSCLPFGALLTLPSYWNRIQVQAGKKISQTKRESEMNYEKQKQSKPVEKLRKASSAVIRRAEELVPFLNEYAADLVREVSLPDNLKVDELRMFVVASGALTAIRGVPPEHYKKILGVIQTALMDQGGTVFQKFSKCRDFCGKYVVKVPTEYDYDKWVDLLAAWGTVEISGKEFSRIDELGKLRKVSSDIVAAFAD